jgi:hypothetical protein
VAVQEQIIDCEDQPTKDDESDNWREPLKHDLHSAGFLGIFDSTSSQNLTAWFAFEYYKNAMALDWFRLLQAIPTWSLVLSRRPLQIVIARRDGGAIELCSQHAHLHRIDDLFSNHD